MPLFLATEIVEDDEQITKFAYNFIFHDEGRV